ncbi:hypothetical protein NUW54_g12427 [Trametes sanguinea]|uniref:Uncharacterized protein n=1 Tax=Trametes sanguinea TaxID=158606 RepID=A0ACC1MY33_9APHY|nr:hypothetical protein NUW54_g12427 [Trametes sanguinea]
MLSGISFTDAAYLLGSDNAAHQRQTLEVLARAHTHGVDVEVPDARSRNSMRSYEIPPRGRNSRHFVQDALRRTLSLRLELLQSITTCRRQSISTRRERVAAYLRLGKDDRVYKFAHRALQLAVALSPATQSRPPSVLDPMSDCASERCARTSL